LSDPDRDRHPGHADPDPADPDRYQVQANEEVDKLNPFSENNSLFCQKFNFFFTHLTLMKKINYFKMCKT